jgi:hypothetical protein
MNCLKLICGYFFALFVESQQRDKFVTLVVLQKEVEHVGQEIEQVYRILEQNDQTIKALQGHQVMVLIQE